MKIPNIFVPEKDLEKKLNELMEQKQVSEEKQNVESEEFYAEIAKNYGYIEFHDF